jgi:hypothetical protein
MNSLNQNQNQPDDKNKVPLYGESEPDWEKLKAYKIANGTFYTGSFATPRGNPHFGLVPIITKYIFLIIAVYYSIRQNYKYTTYALLFYMLGCILNGIRFYYVNTLAGGGEDSKFLLSTVDDNITGAVLAFIAILYIFFKKK